MAEDEEPELWVLGDGGDTAASDGAPAQPPVDGFHSSVRSEDVAGDDWADTSWLDELADPVTGRQETAGTTPPTGAPDRPPPPPPSPPSGAETAGSTPDRTRVDAAPAPTDGDGHAPREGRRSRRSRSSSGGEDVSEFLRELSRLALDD